MVRLLRDGKAIARKEVTAADGWRYSFENLPKTDRYGNPYAYRMEEAPVPGYYGRASGYDLVNARLPEELPPLPQDADASGEEGDPEEPMEFITILDYGVPLYGGALKTGDRPPSYPFALAGIGLIALALAFWPGKRAKRKQHHE